MHIIGPMPIPTPYRTPSSPVRSEPRAVVAPPSRPYATIRMPEDDATSRARPAENEKGYSFALGKACRSLLPFRPTLRGSPQRDLVLDSAIALSVGAFASSIRAAKAGTRAIRLLMGHNQEEELCNTLDHSCFDVWTSGWDLMLTVDGTSRWGKVVLAMMREYPDHRQLSIGGTPCIEGAAKVDGTWLFREFELEEISLVKVGACPGTRLRII